MTTQQTKEQAQIQRLAWRAEVGNRIGIPQEKANKVLREATEQERGEWLALIVDDVVSTTGQESYEALLRLLWCFGVGNIVEGPIA